MVHGSCSLLMVMFSMRWLLLGTNATRALLALIHDRQGDTFHEIHWNMSTEQWSRSTWHTSFQCHQTHIISTLPQPAACVCTLWRSVWAQPPTTTWIGIWDVRAQNKCVQMIGWCYERTGCFCFARQQRVIIPSFVHLMATGWLYSLISLSLHHFACSAPMLRWRTGGGEWNGRWGWGWQVRTGNHAIRGEVGRGCTTAYWQWVKAQILSFDCVFKHNTTQCP